MVKCIAAGHIRATGLGEWSDTSVERPLKDPTAKGIYCSNFTRNLGPKREIKPESEYVFTTVEPISTCE